MTIDETKEILARIENLEKQNRRCKQAAVACVIAVISITAAGGLFAQTQAKKPTKRSATPAQTAASTAPVVPDKLEAESFVLKDSAGRQRAELSMGGLGPSLRFLDQSGTALVTISLNDGAPGGPMLLLSDPDHKASVALSVQQGAGAQLSLTGNQNAQLHMGVTKDGTSVELFDQSGASASIGNGMKISKSGKTQQTSAASIMLFDKDHKMLWSTP